MKLLRAIRDGLRECTPPVAWRTGQQLTARVRFGKAPPWELPARTVGDLWPHANETEVSLVPTQLRQHPWGMPEHELLILGAITRAVQPRRIVEFGTFTGGSTLSMALNSPPEARLVTVDVDPADRRTHVHGSGVGLYEFRTGEMFVGTPWCEKITQQFCDTRRFAMPEWEGCVDLFMVDADHTYEYVRADIATARRMLSPSGVIVWHDYTWLPENPECGGVTRAVNEFGRQFGNCFQITGTRFAVYLADNAR